MEHLILAATDVGLLSCWIGSFYEKKVKEILKIPNRIRVIAMTPLGYPAEKSNLINKVAKIITRSKNRKSLNEIVKYEQW